MRALISVSDKEGIIDFAKGLEELGYEIISTGGTSKILASNGVKVIDVSEITNFPEMMDGRVKTLHPMVHGGILCKRTLESHIKEAQRHQIGLIDVVCVNLYPFKETVMKTDDFDTIIENIDIGGPGMLRSAAKNHESVYVICDKKDYQIVLQTLKDSDTDSGNIQKQSESHGLELRKKLAMKAFSHTAHYDAMISSWFESKIGQFDKDTVTLTFEKKQDLRYGENPHQKAGYYVDPLSPNRNIEDFTQLWGKELSYNNIADITAAIALCRDLKAPAAVAVKHNVPCGAAQGKSIFEAYEKAYSSDPLSIFGGVVALSGIVDEKLANKLSEIFLEVVCAIDFTEEALKVFKAKKNIRLIKIDTVTKLSSSDRFNKFAQVLGGILIGTEDKISENEVDAVEYHNQARGNQVTLSKASDEQEEDLIFANIVCMHAKSNAIVIAKNQMTIGIGQGQVSRVFAAKNAVSQANLSIDGAVAASDAFFPFTDALEECVSAGVTAVVQPGGSVADSKLIDYCNEKGISMYFTGRRHFRHV